mgnify:CR=1 FL=1
MFYICTLLIRRLTYLIAGVLLGLLGTACQDPTEPKDVPDLNQPAFTFNDVRTWYSENAERRIKLEAPTQLVYQNENIFYPDGVTVTMYEEGGQRGTTITADSGRHDRQNMLFKAMGNVRVVNHLKQQTFTSQTLNWNSREHEIYTQDSIEIITPTERLTGIGMTTDEHFAHYKIWQPLGTFVLNGNQQTRDTTAQEMPTNSPSFDSLMQKYRKKKKQEGIRQGGGIRQNIKLEQKTDNSGSKI